VPGRANDTAKAGCPPSSELLVATMDDAALDQIWAVELLVEAIDQTRRECRALRRRDIWDVFRRRTLPMLLENDKPVSYTEMVERWRLRDPQHAFAVARTGVGLFLRTVRRLVGNYLGDEVSDYEDSRELSDLRGALLGPADRPPGDWSVPVAVRRLNGCAALRDAAPEKLAALLSLEDDQLPTHRFGELAAIFDHQLSAPVDSALPLDTLGRSGSLSVLAGLSRCRCHTIGELLGHEAPPMPPLVQLKEFAKQASDKPNLGLPHPVAVTLYSLTIAVALVRRHRRISRLDDDGLYACFTWSIQQGWLPSEFRPLLVQAQAELQTK